MLRDELPEKTNQLKENAPPGLATLNEQVANSVERSLIKLSYSVNTASTGEMTGSAAASAAFASAFCFLCAMKRSCACEY